MTKCARCCLRNSIRVVNLMMLVLGAGIIVYSLWLEKKWDHGIAKFPHRSSPLTPWFIFVFLGVGIVVCLSTVGGHIIAHCISSSTLFLVSFLLIFNITRKNKRASEDCLRNLTIHHDIISILDLNLVYCCRLLPSFPRGDNAGRDFLQDGLGKDCTSHVIFIPVFFLQKISAYTGEENTYFEMVILINVKISRAITILILVAQSSVVILAAILLAAGAEPRTHFLEVDTSIFIQSFLVPTESPGFAEISGQACRRCGTSLSLGGGTARRSFLSRIKSLLGRRFQRAKHRILISLPPSFS
uniref:Uncharacterized protein n=1 Tax=Salix viminalis TaxID=40686 RepID=A0A6N2KZS0_SALVM